MKKNYQRSNVSGRIVWEVLLYLVVLTWLFPNFFVPIFVVMIMLWPLFLILGMILFGVWLYRH